jgi:hypothetical protein
LASGSTFQEISKNKGTLTGLGDAGNPRRGRGGAGQASAEWKSISILLDHA